MFSNDIISSTFTLDLLSRSSSGVPYINNHFSDTPANQPSKTPKSKPKLRVN